MERERVIDISLTVGSLALLYNAIGWAFSLGVRKEVGKLNHWTCEKCGKKFSDGWVIHICHYDHNKDNPKYDHPDNAWCGCIACHHKDHIERHGNNGLSASANHWAINELAHTQQRTQQWLEKHGRM